MAVTSLTTPAAPAPAIPSPPLPRAARQELARRDMHAELTKLLMHGYGSMSVQTHDHRITALEMLTRLLKSPRAAGGEHRADEA